MRVLSVRIALGIRDVERPVAELVVTEPAPTPLVAATSSRRRCASRRSGSLREIPAVPAGALTAPSPQPALRL